MLLGGGFKISESEELLRRIYRHDLASPLNVVDAALRDPGVDKIGVYEHDLEERKELEDAISTVVEVTKSLEDGSLRDVEEEIEEISEYSGRFDYGVGEKIDGVAKMSECISTYLDRYGNGETRSMTIKQVLQPLESYETDISYNGLSEEEVRGDEGFKFVSNTIGLNGIQHGKESENYQMWADVDELEDEYVVEIWDNGAGLSEDYEGDEIFRCDKGDGTGQGLYLGREIVEMFGGSLEYSEDLADREEGFGLEMVLEK